MFQDYNRIPYLHMAQNPRAHQMSQNNKIQTLDPQEITTS